MEKKELEISDEQILAMLTEIGSTIRKVRRSQNLSQTDIGSQIDASKARLSLLENGKVGVHVPFDIYLRLFAACNVRMQLIDTENKVLLTI